MASSPFLVALALASSTLALLVGCSPDGELVPIDQGPPAVSRDTYTFAPGVVQAGPDFVRDVQVEPTHLALPLSYEAYVRGLPVGTLLLGDRAPNAAANNPVGFLRHLESVAVEGDRVIVTTSEGALQEVFTDADLSMLGAPDYAAAIRSPDDLGEIGAPVEPPTESDGEESEETEAEELPDDGTVLPDDSVEPLGTGLELLGGAYDGRSTASMSFNASYGFNSSKIKVKGSAGGSGSVQWTGLLSRKFQISPVIDIKYRSRGLTVFQNVEFGMKLPWSQTDTACSLVEGEVSRSASNILLGKDATKIKVFSGKFPTPALGPIPTTIVGEITLSCAPFVSGKASFKTTTTTGGSPSARFGLDKNGDFFGNAVNATNPSRTTRTWSVEGRGGVKCKADVRVTLLLAGVVGGYLTYSPGIEAGVTGNGMVQSNGTSAGATCVDLKLVHSIDVGVTAGVGKFKIEPSMTCFKKERSLAHACTTDGCQGRRDGWYCDSDDPRGGKRCKGGGVAAGSACAVNTYCQVANASTRAAVVGPTDYPNCVTTKPPAVSSYSPSCN